MKSFAARAGKAILRFLWRHWAGTLITILCLLVGLTGYQMWLARLPAAMTHLPRLALYIALIVLILVVKHLGKRWLGQAIDKGKASLRHQIVQDVTSQGVGRAEATLQQGVSKAKGVWSSASAQVRKDWEHVVGGRRAPVYSAPRPEHRCDACGRILRGGATFCDGCGAAVARTCPKCGRDLRPGSRFCDGCGATVQPAS